MPPHKGKIVYHLVDIKRSIRISWLKSKNNIKPAFEATTRVTRCARYTWRTREPAANAENLKYGYILPVWFPVLPVWFSVLRVCFLITFWTKCVCFRVIWWNSCLPSDKFVTPCLFLRNKDDIVWLSDVSHSAFGLMWDSTQPYDIFPYCVNKQEVTNNANTKSTKFVVYVIFN